MEQTALTVTIPPPTYPFFRNLFKQVLEEITEEFKTPLVRLEWKKLTWANQKTTDLQEPPCNERILKCKMELAKTKEDASLRKNSNLLRIQIN